MRSMARRAMPSHSDALKMPVGSVDRRRMRANRLMEKPGAMGVVLTNVVKESPAPRVKEMTEVEGSRPRAVTWTWWGWWGVGECCFVFVVALSLSFLHSDSHLRHRRKLPPLDRLVVQLE